MKLKTIFLKSGETFGSWEVLKEVDGSERRNFLCRCKCGIEKLVLLSHLRSGKSTQCFECSATKHGMRNTSTYRTWRAMITRCTNPNYKSWIHYGGRGIDISKEWLAFENFYRDMRDRPEGKTLDRIDVNLGYSKSNCRWASAKEQANNTTANRIINFNGENYTCAQLAIHLGIGYHALWSRLRKGQKLDAPLKRILKKQAGVS